MKLTILAAVAVVALAGCSSATPTAPVSVPTKATVTTPAAPPVKATVVQPAPVKPAKPEPAPPVKPAAPAKPAADDSALLACTHFSNVMGDFSKGILTDTQMRDKIQEVYNNASVSKNKGIPDGATAMLAAATANDGTAFMTAAAGFNTACNALS